MGGAAQTPRGTLGQVLLALHTAGGSATRAELTDQVGCGRSVMGYLLGELADRDLVRVDRTGGRAPSADGGRPSHRVVIADGAPTVVAAQISADTFAVATVGLGGRVIARDEHPLRSPQATEALDDLCRLIVRHVHNAHIGHRILGIGVAVPSPIRAADGYAPAALHLGWPGVPMRDLLLGQLHDRHGLDLPLWLANDANLAGLAEYRHGAGSGATQLLYLMTGNVGLGGAVVTDGRLFDGARGYGMEPGHITVDPAGTPCPCGSTGCLEVEADHRGLLRLLGHTDVPLRSVTTMIREVLANADDPAVAEAVRQVNDRLAIGLGSLVNIVDPDRIVLGGTLGRLYRMDPDAVGKRLAQRAFLSDLSQTPIVPGRLPDSVLLGAAELAMQPLLDDPRTVLSGR
jgi:predicted NBD/HSP70 family sugar kinase